MRSLRGAPGVLGWLDGRTDILGGAKFSGFFRRGLPLHKRPGAGEVPSCVSGSLWQDAVAWWKLGRKKMRFQKTRHLAGVAEEDILAVVNGSEVLCEGFGEN